MFVKPAKIVMREEWFRLAPKGAGLNMRDWLAIASIVKRKGIRKCDWVKVKGVVDEYIHGK